VDHHTVAGISIAGSSLDVLGSLYLAYDLLGGEHGPLRLLTRMVTYSIVFGIGYGVGLGLFFGVASGVASGITIAFELNRAARDKPHFSLVWEGAFSAIRGLAFAAGLYRQVGFRYSAAFGVLITLGQISTYMRNMRPATDYNASRKPRITRRQWWASILRTVGYIATALLCSVLVQHIEHPWLLALRVGLVTGIVTTAALTLLPFIEHFADNIPARRMGAFGILLIFVGFTLQSFQYWVVLLDVPVT
jgi:hypothetical protein